MFDRKKNLVRVERTAEKTEQEELVLDPNVVPHEEATLSGHSNDVNCLTVLPDGRLASGSADQTIKLWDVGLSLKKREVKEGSASCATELDSALKSPLVAQPFVSEKETDNKVDKEAKSETAEQASREQELARKAEELEAKLAAEPAAAENPAVLPPKPPVMPSASTTGVTSSESGDRFEMRPVGDALPITQIPSDRIKLGRLLGRGSFGAVYEGDYNYRKVAIKRYEGGRLPERTAREVQQEVGIMQNLDHECLIRLLGLVFDPNSPPMLVMEYGAQGSLYEYLRSDQEIVWGIRLRMAEELARGLAYLHQAHVVHRDIKSLNVVLDRDFHAKWCDFGLAVLKLHTTTTTKQETSSPVGTLRWMAPELFSRRTSTPSTASDIWALGMVFFELASRDVPFKEARDNDQVKDFIKEATGEEVPDECRRESPSFGALMQRCWQERSARPSASDIVTEMRVITYGVVSPAAQTSAHMSANDSGFIGLSHR